MQTACAILPSVACPAVRYFSTLSHRRHDFRKKDLLNIKCMFWFSVQILSETFLILSRTERDIIINMYCSSCKVPVMHVRVWWNLNFLDRFFEKCSKNKFNENPSSGRYLFHTEGQTDKHNESNCHSCTVHVDAITSFLFIPLMHN